ncbi:hypothetical protein COOONC_19790 [Cooperia oncophora]
MTYKKLCSSLRYYVNEKVISPVGQGLLFQFGAKAYGKLSLDQGHLHGNHSNHGPSHLTSSSPSLLPSRVDDAMDTPTTPRASESRGNHLLL